MRYADDFVAMCGTESQASGGLRRIGLVMNRLGLTLRPAKTRLVDLRRGKEGKGRRRARRRPMKIQERVRELTDARQSGKDVKQILAELNPVLRGWGNYRTGNADREFNKRDGLVVWRMRRWQYRRGGQRATPRKAWTGDQLYRMVLHRLQGTVRYPSQATSKRSSLSCVRENRMHRLKGGYMETGQQQ